MRVILCGESAEAAELRRTLGGRGFEVTLAACHEDLRRLLGAHDISIALVDLDRMGAETIRVVREEAPETEVVVVTSYDTADRAVQAMKEGAADFVVRPLRAEELAVRLRRLVQVHDQGDELERVRALLGEDPHRPGMLSDSPSMRTVCDRLALAVDGEMPVLLTGEPGTGKEFLARAIHARGPRRGRPWASLACRTAPPDALPAILALAAGARGGTVLLDDVDALGLAAQQAIRRLVAEGDVRVLATTEVDLAALAEAGRFDRELLHELRAIAIDIPALRDRGEDVLLLARRFLLVLAAHRAEEPKSLSTEAAELLLAYPWPGNVGELRRVVATAHAAAQGREIGATDLPEAVRKPRTAGTPFTLHLDERTPVALADLVRQLEDEIRAWALSRAGGEPDRAAEILGEAAQDRVKAKD